MLKLDYPKGDSMTEQLRITSSALTFFTPYCSTEEVVFDQKRILFNPATDCQRTQIPLVIFVSYKVIHPRASQVVQVFSCSLTGNW